MTGTSRPGWPKLMREALAAEYLDVSVSTLRRLRATRELLPRQVGGSVRYHVDDLDAYADRAPETS